MKPQRRIRPLLGPSAAEVGPAKELGPPRLRSPSLSLVSISRAFLFANARTAHSQQVAGLYSSESASEKSPYPVEGRKGVYTARVTATIPPYCHDCTDCAYHDNSKKKQVMYSQKHLKMQQYLVITAPGLCNLNHLFTCGY